MKVNPQTYYPFLVIIAFFSFSLSYAQFSANQVMGIPQATTAEINNVSGVAEGSMVYDTDQKALFEYSNNAWRKLTSGLQVYTGVFIINGPGDNSITGLPFRPTQITFTANTNIETLNLNADNGTANNDSGLSNAGGVMQGFVRDDSGSITQQVIYGGYSGNSINDISRYASSSHCIGIRYSNQNGDNLGVINASLSSFNADGFTLSANYNRGSGNATDFANETLVVLYTAYK